MVMMTDRTATIMVMVFRWAARLATLAAVRSFAFASVSRRILRIWSMTPCASSDPFCLASLRWRMAALWSSPPPAVGVRCPGSAWLH